jgi:uncharacterized membrane protein
MGTFGVTLSYYWSAMAFCVQCGNKVGDADAFCRKCGARQNVSSAAAPPKAHDPFSGISPRTASLLCYVPWVGWIAAIVVLASDRFRRQAQVRFHAFQGLYIFVAWLMVEWVIAPVIAITDWGLGLHHLGARLLQLVIFAAWIFMMIKVSHDETYKLPIIGDLAERSVSEQRS